MSDYRRAWIPGGTYFFTVNLFDRDARLLVTHVDALRTAFRTTRSVRPFDPIAIVVLPDHLHCVWRLPPDDADNATRWRQIKSLFSRALPTGEVRSSNRARKHERGIWQRRYWEHLIRDDRDLAAHVDYIHINPVKHGHVVRVADWPHSSFHRYVARGDVPVDWAGTAGRAGMFGERAPEKSSVAGRDPPYAGNDGSSSGNRTP